MVDSVKNVGWFAGKNPPTGIWSGIINSSPGFSWKLTRDGRSGMLVKFVFFFCEIRETRCIDSDWPAAPKRSSPVSGTSSSHFHSSAIHFFRKILVAIFFFLSLRFDGSVSPFPPNRSIPTNLNSVVSYFVATDVSRRPRISPSILEHPG